MKRLFILLATVASLSYAQAAEHVEASFLGVGIKSLTITNTVQATNLLAYGVITTNIVGLTWTNGLGSQVVVAGDGSQADTLNPFSDVDLAGFDTSKLLYYGDSANVNTTNAMWGQVYIRLVGQSGANSACTFLLTPVWDSGSPYNDSQVAANQISIAVTANTTTPVTSVTPIPAYKVWGARAIRCLRASNADTDASSAVTILDFRLVGVR